MSATYLNTVGATASHPTRTISITSGKGGVGKTSIVTNMAVLLSRQGKSVLILDGDLGMANVDIFFNVKPRKTLADFFAGLAEIGEVLLQVDQRIWIIPGGSGIRDLQKLNESQRQLLLHSLSRMPQRFDYLLIDTAPGIDNNVMYFNTSAQEICVVVTPDPASIADSYALIKVLHTYYHEKRFAILTNQVRDEAEGLAVYQRLSDVAQKFLYVSLDYWGSIPMDVMLRRSNKNQTILARTGQDAVATQALKKVADKLLYTPPSAQIKGGLQFFWEQLMGAAAGL